MILWQCKPFSLLTATELYEIIKLRIEVFSVEQQCVYQDCDNRDQDSWHLTCTNKERLVAYARILPPGLAYDTASIGRVVTAHAVRGTGLGKKLMKEAISMVRKLFGEEDITISAQAYLISFYGMFGFHTIGESYIEDNIEHIKMKTGFSSTHTQ